MGHNLPTPPPGGQDLNKSPPGGQSVPTPPFIGGQGLPTQTPGGQGQPTQYPGGIATYPPSIMQILPMYPPIGGQGQDNTMYSWPSHIDPRAMLPRFPFYPTNMYGYRPYG